MDQPADSLTASRDSSLFGVHWALGLGAGLLVALAIVTTLRWQAPSGSALDEIVQVPMPKVAPTPTPPPEVLAPDPGDHP